MSEKPWG